MEVQVDGTSGSHTKAKTGFFHGIFDSEKLVPGRRINKSGFDGSETWLRHGIDQARWLSCDVIEKPDAFYADLVEHPDRRTMLRPDQTVKAIQTQGDHTHITRGNGHFGGVALAPTIGIEAVAEVDFLPAAYGPMHRCAAALGCQAVPSFPSGPVQERQKQLLVPAQDLGLRKPL